MAIIPNKLERYTLTELSGELPPDRLAEGSAFPIFSSSLIGESNKRRIIQMLFDLGPTSRADLARLTGKKRTTITGIVQPMIDAGLLVESEPAQKRGVGKPARPLWFSPTATCVCAVVLLPDRIETALINLIGDMAAHHVERISPQTRTRSDYTQRLHHAIEATLSKAQSPVLGIGIAVGGMVDSDEGTIVAMNLAPSLSGFRLRQNLMARFNVDVVVDHHPRAILLGERWFGVGRGLQKFAVIYADEVLGCAMYLNGAPFRGPHGSGGELGHTIVDLDGAICTCGRRGCWETVATLSWMRARAAEHGLVGAKTLDVERLVAMSDVVPAAKELLAGYARNLAIGIINLQTLMMPDNFIIYGNARRGRAGLEKAILLAIEGLATPMLENPINVMTGHDENQITLQGAAGLVISHQLEINY